MSDFVIELLSLSAKASLVAAVVMVIHRVAGRYLPAGFLLALWALVAVRLAVPILPESPVSVVRAAQPAAALPGLADWLPAGAAGAAGTAAQLEPTLHIDLWRAAAAIWVGGMLLLLARRVRAYLQLHRWVRRAAPPAESDLGTLADECRRELGLRRRVKVLESEAVPGPATFGVFRPVVLLPDGFDAAHGPAEKRHMLLHELAHIRRWDPMWLLLSQVLVAVHWFNPVLWWAQRHFHVDLEAACDATVLRRLDGPERSRYGRTLLEVGARRPVAALSPAFAVSSKHQLTRRIVMISRFKSSSPLRVLLLLALAVGLVAVTLTEIPTALASPEAGGVQAEAAELAAKVAETVAVLEGTPEARASIITRMIEASKLEAPEMTAAFKEQARISEEAGDGEVASRLRYLAALISEEGIRKTAPELRSTIQTVRNAGTMMYRRIPEAHFGGEAPAAAYQGISKPVIDWSQCPTVDHSVVQAAVGTDLELPTEDGWGHRLAYCLDVDTEAPRLRIGVRSPGSDGVFDDAYRIGPFASQDTAQDVVWINGYFARWPES